MAPAPQVSGPFTIQTSVGKYSETCLGPRRTFALYLKLADASTVEEMEVQHLSQCSGCGPSPSVARHRQTAIKQTFSPTIRAGATGRFPK